MHMETWRTCTGRFLSRAQDARSAHQKWRARRPVSPPSQVQHTHSTRTAQHPRVGGLLTDIHPIGGVGTKGAAITAAAPATTARRARGRTISNVWGEALRNHRTFGFLCSVSVSLIQCPWKEAWRNETRGRWATRLEKSLREVSARAHHGCNQDPDEDGVDDPLGHDLDPHGDAALLWAGSGACVAAQARRGNSPQQGDGTE